MRASRHWWLYFFTISSPFFLVLIYLFAITGKAYWDTTSDISLQHWVAMSLGWELSDWSFLLYNADDGFRDHHPAIPQIQIAAVYGWLFGLPVSHLDDYAVLGVGLIVMVVVLSSAWGAQIAKTVNVPPVVLFAASSVAAVQPAIALTWIAYQYYIPLLIPCGLAITSLHKVRDENRFMIMAVFAVLGYATSITYLAAIPIVALAIAAFSGLRYSNYGDIFQAVSRERFSGLYMTAVVSLTGIFVFGFANVGFRLPAKLADYLRDGTFSKLEFLVTLGVLALSGIVTIYLVTRKFNASPWFNVYLATVGRGVIGWALGANLLALASWHSGLLFSGQTGTVGLIGIGGILEFIFATRPWLWILPIMWLGSLAMVFKMLSRHDDNAQSVEFQGVFVFAVITINLFVLPLIGADPQSMGGYIEARVLASITIGLPIVLMWSWQRARFFGSCAATGALIITGLSILDQHRIFAPVTKSERLVSAFLNSEISAYRQINPHSRVLCINAGMAGQCEVDRVYDYYRPFHDGNKKNKPLPRRYGDDKNANIGVADKACKSWEACGLPARASGERIIVLGRKQNFPPAIHEYGTALKTKQHPPSDVVILEVR